MIDDTMSLSLDNANYYNTNLIDEYLTKLIIRDQLGIDNVHIKASGDFSAITLTQAQVGTQIANLGVDVMTVDEFRIKIMHLAPLGGSLGQEFLGKVLRDALMAKSDSNLTKAVGPVKHLLPDYRESYASKTIHRLEEIKYY
jgi:hypothetical protein